MTDFTEQPEPPPSPPAPPRALGARLRRFVLTALLLVAVVAALGLGVRRQVGVAGRQQRDALVVQITEAEPGWRIEDIEAERAARRPPPERDGALAVLAAADRIPAEWEAGWRNDAEWMYQLPEPYRPADKHLARLKAAGPPSADARALAHKLRDLPTGHYPVEFPPDRYDLTQPHLGKLIAVCDLLEYDAAHASLVDRDPNRAIRSAHALLNAARSLGDEPTLGAQLMRMSHGIQAARVAMQALAWGEPADGLAELQAAFLAEAGEPLLLNAMRGHRANMHRLVRGLEAGHYTFAEACGGFPCYRPPLARPEVFAAYRPLLPGDHAEALRRLTAGVALAKRPTHEQYAAAYALRDDHPDGFRYSVTRQFVPQLDFVVGQALGTRAALETAAVGLACERYRQTHNRWPNDLAELVPAYLAAVPANPFDAAPPHYRVLGDRVTISCRADHPGLNQAPREEFDDPDAPGMTVGVQLWLPPSRGLPPKPKENDPPQQDMP